MVKIINPTYFIGGQEIAENSLDVDYGDLVAIKDWAVTKAIPGDRIEWVSVETKTFDSDNQTVKGEKLEYVAMGDFSRIEATVSGWTIAQANLGSIYDIKTDGTVNGATITPVAQVDTVTLTGTSGTATISGAGTLSKVATFDTDLATTAAAFVTANAAAYASQGITITSSTADIIFTATIAGTPFTSPSIANTTTDLDGTVANTTSNVSAASQLILKKVKTTTLGDFVRAK